jgi:signal peptidase I
METKTRKPWLAGLLSFLLPGLGHIYCGQAKRGIIIYVILEIIVLVALASLLLPIPILNVSITALTILAAYLYIIVNSVKTARLTNENYELKKYNRWYVYVAIFLIAGLLIDNVTTWATKRFYVQSYNIPSGAMIPTLKIGDHIIANKFIYRFDKPKTGDIIIFQYPKDPNRQFIKRVVAIGGDKIEIKNKKLYVNNTLIKEPYVVHGDTKTEIAQRDNYGPFIVPQDSFFVMGDNRDYSYDSRFWGFVTIDAVQGKAHSIYWSWDKVNTSVRWNRIGQLIK